MTTYDSAPHIAKTLFFLLSYKIAPKNKILESKRLETIEVSTKTIIACTSLVVKFLFSEAT